MTARYGTAVVPARPRDPLSHREAAPSSPLRAPAWRDILDFDGNDVAAPQLAVDGEVEHGQVPDMSSTCRLVRIDQTCLGRSGGLAPISLPLSHGIRFGILGTTGSLSCMGLCSDQENDVSALRAGSLLTSHRTVWRHAIERASR